LQRVSAWPIAMPAPSMIAPLAKMEMVRPIIAAASQGGSGRRGSACSSLPCIIGGRLLRAQTCMMGRLDQEMMIVR